jgi:hypothetical protein
MAAAIVKSFPCLGIRESGSVKHDHYYDPKAGGFLETRLKTLRRNLPAEQRKRKASGTPLCSKSSISETKRNFET